MARCISEFLDRCVSSVSFADAHPSEHLSLFLRYYSHLPEDLDEKNQCFVRRIKVRFTEPSTLKIAM